MSDCKHLAIIMDGNGRYAQNRAQSRTDGHSAGAKAVRRVIGACQDLGIQHLTLFCFSTENWARPASEVSFLFNLLSDYISAECQSLMEKNIRLQVIGDLSALPKKLQEKIEWVKQQTKNGTFTLQLAINYGGRAEITNAMRQIGTQLLANTLTINDINEKTISANLACHDIGEPDLLVRTSGEQRISNFLLWQISYSEILFERKYWPEITQDDVAAWVEEFQQRKRRYGGL